MATFACTQRGYVFEIYPYTKRVGYWDEPDGQRREHRNAYTNTAEVSQYRECHVSSLRTFEAPNLDIAKVEALYLQALTDVLSDVIRMFTYARSDRESLARRAARKR